MLGTYGFLGWIVIGAVAGALAKWIMPGKDPGGCLVTIALGIAGALLAGFIAATLGAILLLWLYRLLMRRR